VALGLAAHLGVVRTAPPTRLDGLGAARLLALRGDPAGSPARLGSLTARFLQLLPDRLRFPCLVGLPGDGLQMQGLEAVPVNTAPGQNVVYFEAIRDRAAGSKRVSNRITYVGGCGG